ncbi:MAG: TIGR03905 family TSCPD domain-containing protein [Lachnospiraceae bacterium]|nr:TIGR03905 family TSCPD domain-containing protein [Lachnospiraceae bacterium]
MTTTYTPVGVCSTRIDIEMDGEMISHVQFTGGCHGNTQGVSRLVEGMRAQDAIAKLKGINCKGRGTSCPDQLARALEEALKNNRKEQAPENE